MKKPTLVGLLAVLVLALAPGAAAHLPAKPKGDGLQARLVSQTENLAHARYVARHGRGDHVRWHRLAARWLERELAETRSSIDARRVASLGPHDAIRRVFGAYAAGAIDVARCETGGTFSVYARNGQYLGLFQMGSWERATYGHGWTPWEQARAAYRYFVASGRDWSPWQCRPGGHLGW